MTIRIVHRLWWLAIGLGLAGCPQPGAPLDMTGPAEDLVRPPDTASTPDLGATTDLTSAEDLAAADDLAAGADLASAEDLTTSADFLPAGANVAIRVAVTGGAENQVDHYVVALQKDGATFPLAGSPATLPTPAPANGSFTNVPNGTNYTIEARAEDPCDGVVASVTSAAFDIVAGVVVDHGSDVAAPDPILATITLPTQDLSVSVAGGSAVGQAGMTLLNLLSSSTTTLAAKSVAVDPTNFLFSDVAVGRFGGTSHTLYSYFTNDTTQATVAKAKHLGGNCGGQITETSVSLTWSMTQTPADVATNNTGPARLHTGGFGHTYFFNAAGTFLDNDNQVVDLTNAGMASPPDVTVFGVTVVSGHDTFFYFDANDSTIHSIQNVGAPFPTAVVDLTGHFTSIAVIAADAGGAVYWLDGGKVWKLPADLSNATFADAVAVIDSGTVTDFAVDAFGNVYYAIGNKLYEATLGTKNGTNYTVPAANAQRAIGTSVIAKTLSVDAAGDLYFEDDGTATNNLKMIPAGSSTVYSVIGTSAVTVQLPSVGADGTLFYLDNGGGPSAGHTFKL